MVELYRARGPLKHRNLAVLAFAFKNIGDLLFVVLKMGFV